MTTTALLRFTKENVACREALSAVAPIGETLWVASDEGTALVRLTRQDDGSYGAAVSHDLVTALDLPGTKPDKKGELPETDIEGMDWEPSRGYLWVIGSHSLKRKKPEADKSTEDNLKRLAKVEADGNRYLLGRIPLNAQGDAVDSTENHFAARLDCDLFSSDLLTAMHKDEHFGRFVPALSESSPKENIPGKDNGFDIEGLAVVGENHLLIGIRGPVLRGWAALLEVELDETHIDKGVGQLDLKKLEGVDRLYRKIFLELDGLGVRDLCWVGDDLLILAGPSMALDWPPVLFRWVNARAGLNGDDQFVWQGAGVLERLRLKTVDAPIGKDRAEGLAVLPLGGEQGLLIAFDSPSDARLSEPMSVTVDVVPIP